MERYLHKAMKISDKTLFLISALLVALLSMVSVTFANPVTDTISGLGSTASDFFEAEIDDICKVNLDLEFASTLTKTAKNYNSKVYKSVKTIMNVCFGIGASLLSIFMLTELVAIIQRADSSGSGFHGMQIPANLMIRWGIITFLYCHSNVLLEGIQAVIANLTTQINYSNTAQTLVAAATVKATVDSMGIFSKLFAYMAVFIIWVCFQIFKYLISVFVVFRIFKIWMMTMFAPIPLATIASSEFKQTAYNFIKSFAATCLSGTVIVAAITLYTTFFPTMFNQTLLAFQSNPTFAGFCSLMLKSVLNIGVLVTVCGSSGRFSKSLLNAM